VAVLVLLAPVQALAQAPPASLDVCRAEIDRNPRYTPAYYCIYRFVLAHGQEDQAVELLRHYQRRNPDVYRIQMFIAWIDRIRERDSWMETLGRAVDGMEATGDDFGVVYGGLMLAFELGQQGKLAESEALLERCARAAARTKDPIMQARVWVGEGALAMRRQDYSRDIHLLRLAERAVFPDGPYDIRATVIDNLGSDFWYLCQYRKAFEAFQRATRVREEAHDLWWQAITVYDMALCAMNMMDQGEMTAPEVNRLLERGLDLAVRSSNAEIEAGMQVLMGRWLRGEAARSHFQEALAIARRHSFVTAEIEAMEGLAGNLAERGPSFRREAEDLLQRAARRARETGQRFLLAQVMASRARLEALYGTPKEAVQAHLETLGFIEDLRAPGVRGAVRAQTFSHWRYVYYRLAGLLLARAKASATPEQDLALAFRTMERFRARELLEELGSRRTVSPEERASEPYRERETVLRRIAAVQRTLADPDLDAAGRQRALARLGRLEEDASRLKDELLRRFPDSSGTAGAAIPKLRAIQALLARDQAMLSYQLWDGEPGRRPHLEVARSWLLVLTRDRVRAIGLLSRRDLRARVGMVEGALTEPEATPDSTASLTVRLYDDLLAGALDDLPGNVRRLVIVPDDVLWRCPFAALRPSPDAEPAGCRFEITTVPSAAVWAHIKRREPGAGARSAALILSAPACGASAEEASSHRAAGPWREGLRLPPLPHAAEEARALLRAAGPGSRMLTGAEASEAALKRMPLASFGILDLVTHAAVDEEQAERSAIILAPGSPTEDGFLQVREIPELDLDGQLVILSSCSSSSGKILGGEGAQSLARSFLEAGAGAVLASLWPLEDQQAASLFSELSHQLGRGRRVAEALRLAQRHSIETGMPTGAWAGVVVLGDGDLRPLPPRGTRRFWLPFLLLMGVVLLGVLLLRRTR